MSLNTPYIGVCVAKTESHTYQRGPSGLKDAASDIAKMMERSAKPKKKAGKKK
jgi:hypothetical protein